MSTATSPFSADSRPCPARYTSLLPSFLFLYSTLTVQMNTLTALSIHRRNTGEGAPTAAVQDSLAPPNTTAYPPTYLLPMILRTVTNR